MRFSKSPVPTFCGLVKKNAICFFLVVFFFLSVSRSAHAQRPKWFLSLYEGIYSANDLKNIALGSTEFKNSKLLCLALSHEVCDFWNKRITGEWEAQFAKHFGFQDHVETNVLFLLRWHSFPWDRFLETSFAVGDGLSYAWGRPQAEVIESDSSTRLLNYLLFEFCFTPNWELPLSLIFRIHHRSGVFGLFNGTHGGSNFVSGGIRLAF